MNNETKNAIITTICVVLILAIVYFSTAVFMTGEIGNNKINRKTTTTVSTTTDTYDDMILASNTFNKSDDNYMVVFFSKKSVSNELKDAIKNYSGDNKLYKVNLDDPMNKFVIGDSDNLLVSNISELKVKDCAILTIQNGSVVSFASGGANIIKTLK